MSKYNFDKSIFRSYDIRGTYGENINENVFHEIGLLFGSFLNENNFKNCIVGMDGRNSSKNLKNSFINGLIDCGIDVFDIGLVPTPLVYYGQKKLNFHSGAIITGSHNPKEDNGLKLLTKEGPFFDKMISDLIKINIKKTAKKGNVEKLNLTDDYIKNIFKDYKKVKRKLKIAWDPGNGATCDVMHELQKNLPHDSYNINDKIDGNFPAHSPDPTKKENLVQLINLVMEKKCDFGIAFDGDGDRMSVVNSNGDLLSGDMLVSFFSKDILKNNKKLKIIHEIKSSSFVGEYIRGLGGEPVLCRTGHSWIKKKINEETISFAGEVSGHYFFNDKYYGFDDGLYAVIRFINIMENTNSSVVEMFDFWPDIVSSGEIKIPVEDSKKFHLIKELQEELRNKKKPFIDIDGIRVEMENGWYVIRASNTGPNIVCIAEASNKIYYNEIIENLFNLLKSKNIQLPKIHF